MLLNKGLLQILAKEVGIEQTVITSQDVGRWDLLKLPHLITNAEMLKDNKDEEQLKLYRSILSACFRDDFSTFLTDTNQADETGQDVASHNKQVGEAFKEANIDWTAWNNFQDEFNFDLVAEKQKDPLAEVLSVVTERFQTLLDQLKDNKDYLTLANALAKDIRISNQDKKNLASRLKEYASVEDFIAKTLANYIKTFEFLQNKAVKDGQEFSLPTSLMESYNHLVESLSLLFATQQNPRESTLVKESFRVRKWRRDPRRDFFQGNYTHCCISVGVKETPVEGGLTTFHPETIQQYLVDQGIQVIEVVDEEGHPIAQTWFFVSKDKDGKPIGVMDNIEVNNKYGIGKSGNTLIKEHIFAYVKLYSQQCGIDKVVLGTVSTNDVSTNELKTVAVNPISKLGGYLWDDDYYLESLEDEEAYLVADDILRKKK